MGHLQGGSPFHSARSQTQALTVKFALLETKAAMAMPGDPPNLLRTVGKSDRSKERGKATDFGSA